jgi:hypothetical protein
MSRIRGTGLGRPGLVGQPPTTVDAVAIWGNTDGTLLENSEVTIDANGYVYAAGILTNNSLASTAVLTIASTQSMIVVGDYLLSGIMYIQGNLLVL